MFNFFKPTYYVSLCCIVKDEDDYLEEWISYHRRIGVEKFYIYDNESKIPIASTLAKLIEEKVVVVTDISGSAVQCEAYKLCLRKHGRKSRWMGFIDLDEFIVPKSTSGNLRLFLKDYEQYGAVGINWQCSDQVDLQGKQKNLSSRVFFIDQRRA